MGRGGHNVKPAAQKRAEGTSRKDRDAGRVEDNLPTFEGELMPPPHFDAQHKARFKECCRLMKEAGVLQPMDYDAIVLYVENQIMAANAWNDIQENGITLQVPIMSKDGEVAGYKPITNPAFRQYQDCQKVIKPLMEQFAFTPRARMSIKVKDTKPKAESAILKAINAGAKKVG